ncbi:hypothetical protein BST11_15355 [Mycobacterium alsense]|uniref:NUMOD4 domain-containing protein n=1 Tax=Mycobacterium alsense TaxID=324058 RepID=A0AA41XQ76_9MYCO|nr:NUMOD4 domain-containing protein [Mycobacterium alsense]MCV7379957.1 hypothetical protein [Mycobacterium alsense]OQZ89949.1 hypothetical protein BST11_15355 [Mycobacterium alsense]
MSVELFRPVDGWVGFYEVSSRGCVRSVARVVETADGQRRRVPGRLLKLSDGRAPHCTLSRPGRRQTYYPKANGRRNYA